MYDLLSNLWLGAGIALTPLNIMLCLIGATVGTLIGVLPGIGSLATIAMLLPITFGLPPVGALIMLAGLLMSMIGSDLETGAERMSFGLPELSDGIGFVVVAMGMFGFGEILRNLEQPGSREIVQAKVTGLMPTLPDLKASAGAIGRGTIIGSILGILPGGGAIIASFAAYTFEKKMSKHPERFGRGAIEGVAAPESANNAAAQTSFIPLLTLGIPPNPVMALMVGAMTIHGIVPGPQVMTKQPELFWGMIASMWIGNLALIVINLPMVGIWVRLLRVPYRHLFPMIVIFCCIGVYSLNNAPFDVSMTAIFGVVGYWLVKHDFEPAPMILGFVLGPLMEENLRRAMLIARGDATVFLTRPISATLLAIAAFMLVLAVLPAIRGKRDEVFTE